MNSSSTVQERVKAKIPSALAQNPRLVMFVVLVIVSTVLSKGVFLSPSNIHNMLRQYATIGIMAVGQTVVILLAGVDLSQGSMMALVSMVVAYLNVNGFGLILPLLAGLLVGALGGLFSGTIITRAKVPPFIATLAMASICRGLATLMTQSRPIYGLSKELLVFGRDTIGGLGIQVVIWICVGLLGIFLITRTVYGRGVYAVGGNEQSAHLSGINVQRVKLLGYAFSGICAAIAAIVITSRMDMGGPYVNANDNVQSIASVVIGGTSFAGGRGTVSGTILGTVIIAMINNLMNLMLINPYIQQGIIGAIIVITVTLNHRRAKVE
ncbi:MAG: ABC transporter permease [Firmicutes bacterium]|nr:ABC transporter permease [Bacillota bacterium]